MNGPRAQNPTAATGSTAGSKPAAPADKTAVASKGSGEGTTNDKYLQETREQNPDPNEEKKDQAKVSLGKCQFVTPKEELKLNEPFEFSVEVKKIGEAKSMSPAFDLYCTRTREGKEERDKIWGGKEGKPVDPKADPVVVKGKDVLATQSDYQLGEKVVFELEATHQEADEPAKSEPMEVGLKSQVTWVGGDDLFFRNDGEFPLLKEDASLIEVLASAVERIENPPQKSAETVICFGFASSAGGASHNRKLSLRRAQAVKAILDRDNETWVALAKLNFTTLDLQQFLSDLNKGCGWECDPGEIDGKSGPKTKAAIQSFQKECNARYALGLKEDGVAGPKTWGAALRVITGQMQDALGQDSVKEPAWTKPNWGHDSKGVYANGEDFATGGDKPEERSVQISFFSPGSEPVLVDAPDGDPSNPDLNPVQCAERYEKMKLERKKKSGGVSDLKDPVPAEDVEDDNEPWVFYLPGRDQYILAEKLEEKKLLLGAIDWMSDLYNEVANYRTEAAKNGFTKEQAETAKQLRDKVEGGLKSLPKKPADAIQELLLIRGNPRHGNFLPRTYIRPSDATERANSPRWVSNNDPRVIELVDEMLRQGGSAPHSNREVKKNLKWVWFDPKAAEGNWPLRWKIAPKQAASGPIETPVGTFSGSAEAQFMRWMAGCEAGAEVDLAAKKIQIGGTGMLSYNLIEGKAEGSWNLPSDQGFNIFDVLILSDKAREAIKSGKKLLFRVNVKLEVKAFIGASLSASAMLPAIEYSGPVDAKAGLSGSAFAGGSIEGKAALGMEWHSPAKNKFECLFTGAGVVSGNAGAGAEGRLDFRYKNGKIFMGAGGMLTWGLGMKLAMEYELDVAVAISFLGDIYNTVEWRRIDSVSLAVFEVFVNATFAPFVIAARTVEVTAKKIESAYEESKRPIVSKMSEFVDWLESEVDDVISFANTKATTYLATQDPELLRLAPPETLGRVIQLLTSSFDQEDFKAIQRIVQATKSGHEAKWMIRNSQTEVVLGPGATDAQKDKAFVIGLQKLQNFGKDRTGYPSYRATIDALLHARGVL